MAGFGRSTLVLFGLALLLLLAASAASQAVALPGDEPEPPHEAAPPREWATLEVSFSSPADLAANIGQKAVLPVSVTNNGNVPALGVVVSLDGSKALAGADAPQPLLYFELQALKTADGLLVIDLKPLLGGEVPKDLFLNVFYCPDE